MNWPCEAKHLHGHSGLVTIELEDTVDPVTGFADACKEGFKKTWEVCDHFHHATIFQEGDPLLDAVLAVYKKEGINNDPEHCVPLKKIDHELTWSYPEYRIVVSKKVTTCENWCELLNSVAEIFFSCDNAIMKKILLSVCFLLISPVFLCGQEIDKSFFQDYDTALVIYNRSTGEVINTSSTLTALRLSPCSTFKIYNTLIGLELGLIQGADNSWYEWDGVKRFLDEWNNDLTLREAFRVSAVPAYKILARQIGAEQMEKYLDVINYGNKDISAGIDIFWLNSSEGTQLIVSADEQVALLNKLLDGKLPFSKKNIGILRDIMQVVETEKGTLYGKTGSSMNSDGEWNLGWFVGFLESRGTTYVFACNITGGEKPSGVVAREIVKNVFRSQSLL